MNMHAPIEDIVDLNMTSKGQVLIPKAIRDKIGLVPNGPVRVGINDRGEAVILPLPKEETREQRVARVRAGIEKVRGTLKSDFASTDEYMDFIRPHRLEKP